MWYIQVVAALEFSRHYGVWWYGTLLDGGPGKALFRCRRQGHSRRVEPKARILATPPRPSSVQQRHGFVLDG